MKKLTGIFFILLFISNAGKAQLVNFLKKGHIQYERRINLHARLHKPDDGDNNSWYESLKKNMPQFLVTNFDYYFDGNVSLYTPAPSQTVNSPFVRESQNTVYTMLDSMMSISQKELFEQKMLIKDSVRQINWKITNETRKIAGFDCRRANAIIMDSVYVVAFYTDAILPSGGPESFTGLPGTILGVALPHEHMTWFATKVVMADVKKEELKPPVKGKAMNNKSVIEEVSKLAKRWDEKPDALLKAIML